MYFLNSDKRMSLSYLFDIIISANSFSNRQAASIFLSVCMLCFDVILSPLILNVTSLFAVDAIPPSVENLNIEIKSLYQARGKETKPP